MDIRTLFALFAVSFSVACTTAPPVAQISATDLWRDQDFDFSASEVIESKASLFALDPALETMLTEKRQRSLTVNQRLDYLVATLFSQGGIRIAYMAGHSTNPTETWESKRGDCMSLTLLTYSVAKTLGIDASMQEVRVPVAVDRRNGTDFVSGHVNVLIHNTSALVVNGRGYTPGGMIIDFEPQIGSRRQGTPLSDDQIIARFYNNRATEHLASKNYQKAYTYFKAAITADPTFAPAYNNLAQLYLRHKLNDAAEQLLRYAIALNDKSDAPLRTLQNLLIAQGRLAEAEIVAQKLRRFESEDPYYWVAVGIDHLQHNRNRKAIDALQRAKELTTGFEEVHRYLAIAYWRSGEQKQANRELSVLSAMLVDDPSVAKLSAKLSRSPSEVSVQ